MLPSVADYTQAIQNLRVTMADAELRDGEAAKFRGQTMRWVGGFAVVFKVHCQGTGNTWAVKCFTREARERRARYREIAAHLQQARLRSTVEFQYLDQGIRVDGKWHPVVKMRWVEGLTLNKFVEDHLDRPAMLRQLLSHWPQLAQELRKAQVAHGDLQHGNVLMVPVKEGAFTLNLVDYDGPHEDQQQHLADAFTLNLEDNDGLWVPGLANMHSGELGHENFQHPQRFEKNLYNFEVDRFPHLVIYTAVHALASGQRQLWRAPFNTGQNLLFRKADLKNPAESPLFRKMWAEADPHTRALTGWLILARKRPLAETPLLDEILQNGNVVDLRPAEQREVEHILNGTTPITRGGADTADTALAYHNRGVAHAKNVNICPTRLEEAGDKKSVWYRPGVLGKSWPLWRLCSHPLC